MPKYLNGKLYITLEEAKDKKSRKGVIAHEIAHKFDKPHAIVTIQTQKSRHSADTIAAKARGPKTYARELRASSDKYDKDPGYATSPEGQAHNGSVVDRANDVVRSEIDERKKKKTKKAPGAVLTG